MRPRRDDRTKDRDPRSRTFAEFSPARSQASGGLHQTRGARAGEREDVAENLSARSAVACSIITLVTRWRMKRPVPPTMPPEAAHAFVALGTPTRSPKSITQSVVNSDGN